MTQHHSDHSDHSATQPSITFGDQPLSLDATLVALGIKSPATLRKLRAILRIEPIRGLVGSKSLYFSAEDIILMQYALQHPYVTANLSVTASQEEHKQAVQLLREKALAELKTV